MFSRLSIPTPFQVGPVNAYLGERTLFDPGPDSDDAWDTLTEKLASQDTAPEEIQRVVVTHPHPDHFGLARRFRDLNAEILASPETASIVEAFDDRLAYEQRYFEECFTRHGMDPSTVETVTTLPEAFLPFAPNCPVDRTITDGDELTVGGTTLVAEAVTGHAPGELLFTYEYAGERRAIMGDHVLGDITPNPLLHPPMDPNDERPRVLPAFNDSLAALEDRPFDLLLPGHGGVIEEPQKRIGEILAAHEDRTENVATLVDEPTTAHEVMGGLFENLPVTEYFPAMSEAIGHLDVLETRGRVTSTEIDGRIVYTRR